MGRVESFGIAFYIGASMSAVVFAQPRNTIEILAIDSQGNGVRGEVYLLLPDNKEEFLTETDTHGVANAERSKCKHQYRVVLRPFDRRYFESSDVRCAVLPQRLELTILFKGTLQSSAFRSPNEKFSIGQPPDTRPGTYEPTTAGIPAMR